MVVRRVVVALSATLVLLSALVLPVGAQSQTTGTDKRSSKSPPADPLTSDSSFVLTPGSSEPPRYSSFQKNTARPLSMYLARDAYLLYGFETYKLSRVECAIEGAGMGMTLGMTVGALGMTTGLWDERTSWYVAGAMAAVGAIFGGAVKADDPNWNLRVRWEPNR